MTSLAADALAKAAVREKVRGLRLATGNAPAVALEDGTLVFTTAVTPADWYTRAELERALQSVL